MEQIVTHDWVRIDHIFIRIIVLVSLAYDAIDGTYDYNIAIALSM